MPAIPYGRLETIFLDVGNTLVSMDYHWIRRELDALGVAVDLDSLMRAEAGARPRVSQAVAGEASTEGTTIFHLYMKTLVENLVGEEDRVDTIVDGLVPALRGPGREMLWSFVLDGVPEALDELRELGLRLAVVSNSDGNVEEVLRRRGLRDPLSHVFDSHLVGFEKPDRRFFEHAVAVSGARPETTLHVGDLYAGRRRGGTGRGAPHGAHRPVWRLARRRLPPVPGAQGVVRNDSC